MGEQQPELRFRASSDRQDQGPSSASAEEKQTSGLDYIKAERDRFHPGSRLCRVTADAYRRSSSIISAMEGPGFNRAGFQRRRILSARSFMP